MGGGAEARGGGALTGTPSAVTRMMSAGPCSGGVGRWFAVGSVWSVSSVGGGRLGTVVGCAGVFVAAGLGGTPCGGVGVGVAPVWWKYWNNMTPAQRAGHHLGDAWLARVMSPRIGYLPLKCILHTSRLKHSYFAS